MNIKKAVLLALLAVGLSMPAWADDASIGAQLKSIQAKQDEILARLASLQTEIEIVKVRATK